MEGRREGPGGGSCSAPGPGGRPALGRAPGRSRRPGTAHVAGRRRGWTPGRPGRRLPGRLSGLGLGRGDCPPIAKGAPLCTRHIFLRSSPCGPRCYPCPGGGGGGGDMACAGLCSSVGRVSLMVSQEQEQVTPGGTGSRKLWLNSLCISGGGLWGLAGGLCHQGRQRPSPGTDPKTKGSEMDPPGRLSHQKLLS